MLEEREPPLEVEPITRYVYKGVPGVDPIRYAWEKLHPKVPFPQALNRDYASSSPKRG